MPAIGPLAVRKRTGSFPTPSSTTTVPAVTPADVTVADTTVTTYPLTAAPPSSTGANHVSVAMLFRNEVPDTPVGEPGTVAGTTAADGSDAADEPIALVATTENT